MQLQRLTNALSVQSSKKRTVLVVLVALCVLLCGFDWGVSFLGMIAFPFQDAVDLDMVSGFASIVNVEQLQSYLEQPDMAEEIVAGIQANLSGNVYRIELPDFGEEHLGMKIVSILLDRLFH